MRKMSAGFSIMNGEPHNGITILFTTSRDIADMIRKQPCTVVAEEFLTDAVIEPLFFADNRTELPPDVIGRVSMLWESSVEKAQETFQELISMDYSVPLKDAMSILPGATAVNISITATLEQWKTIFEWAREESTYYGVKEVVCLAAEEMQRRYPLLNLKTEREIDGLCYTEQDDTPYIEWRTRTDFEYQVHVGDHVWIQSERGRFSGQITAITPSGFTIEAPDPLSVIYKPIIESFFYQDIINIETF